MTPDNHPYHISAHEQIEAIKANDHGFLQWLYREYYPQTEAYVLQNSGTTDEAKDVYQEAFIAMWRNVQMNRFEPKNDHSLAAYLLQIAKHKWLDHLRSAGYKKTKPLTELEIATEEAAAGIPEEISYTGQVKERFVQLGDNCRKVLTAFYFKKESMRDIAASMGWTEATARNNKYRCIERLRALMKDLDITRE